MADGPRKQSQEPGFFAKLWAITQRGGSAGWLLTTALQALLTWAFIGISKLSEGLPWEHQARQLVLIAIVATWCMALRTIRQRLIELLRTWHIASQGLVAKAQQTASESGIAKIPELLQRSLQGVYVRQSILRLRIIAAGLTMPFFILPIFAAGLAVSLCMQKGAADSEWLGLAAICALISAVVGVYFHWSILPAPAPVRISARKAVLMRPRR